MIAIEKYPRTPHLEGSNLAPGDTAADRVRIRDIVRAYPGAVWVIEEKLDGANTGLSLDPETFDLLSALAAGDWATADASGGPARREAAGIVAAYLQFHAERRLVSLSVLDQDLGLPAPRVERRP